MKSGERNMRLRAAGWAVLFAMISVMELDAAGKYNPMLSIGDPAPIWKDLPGTDGQTHSLADLKDIPVVVLVFTCNSCPYAVDYEDRLIAFAKRHAGKVAVVAVNVNTIEEDRLPKMKERADAKSFPFPYIFDETQVIAKNYGATFTPEFFVLNQDRKIVYMGGMDDNSDAAKVTNDYLEMAVNAVLKGKPIDPAETVARGCMVRYERKRRRPAKAE